MINQIIMEKSTTEQNWSERETGNLTQPDKEAVLEHKNISRLLGFNRSLLPLNNIKKAARANPLRDRKFLDFFWFKDFSSLL